MNILIKFGHPSENLIYVERERDYCYHLIKNNINYFIFKSSREVRLSVTNLATV